MSFIAIWKLKEYLIWYLQRWKIIFAQFYITTQYVNSEYIKTKLKHEEQNIIEKNLENYTNKISTLRISIYCNQSSKPKIQFHTWTKICWIFQINFFT